ncbi:hypothetical protein I4F81_005740 [Pyropia yezoensis]|uniref:Uncharacterized protein n=1 Tax=Pyropia yezoensis TaxID=2788 RepID=A0ACC3C059_PYRYE|nr:hypothetical protein I4F81_005740 [Neopyropia yezoensis]
MMWERGASPTARQPHRVTHPKRSRRKPTSPPPRLAALSPPPMHFGLPGVHPRQSQRDSLRVLLPSGAPIIAAAAAAAATAAPAASPRLQVFTSTRRGGVGDGRGENPPRCRPPRLGSVHPPATDRGGRGSGGGGGVGENTTRPAQKG